MIKGKIEQVGDYLCGHCAQNYQDECRAFEIPHSARERTQREKGDCLCQSKAIALVSPKEQNL